MAFAYAQGTATSIANFFTIFETWITSTIGWTVVSGTGTQDLVLSSDGEYGDYAGYTGPIYVRISQLTADIYGQAYLDAAGTQATIRNTSVSIRLNASGDSFDYWMSADKEAIVIVGKNLTSGNYYRLYTGTLIPYSKIVSGPEWFMAAGSLTSATYMLRDTLGDWNRSTTNYHYGSNLITDPNQLDNSITLFGLHVGTALTLQGQLRHISARIYINELAALDRVKTGPLGNETEWIILPSDSGTTVLFALRTGGVVSSGEDPEANFQITEGYATDKANWYALLESFMVGTLGWTVESGSGTEDIVYSSIGESGTDTIIIHLYNVGATVVSGRVQDDLVPTHETSIAYIQYMNSQDFPKHYYFAGDKDCILMVSRNAIGDQEAFMYLGVLVPFSRNLSSTSYKAFAYSLYSSAYIYLLQKQQTSDSWDYTPTLYAGTTQGPSPIDPLAYHLSAVYVYQGAAPVVAVGYMKYMLRSIDNPVISVNDTIQIGSRIYRHFYHTAGGYWALRIQ